MRIAVLADIHGNLQAFEAALKHVSQQKVDRIILAGDILIGSPDTKACWDLALSLGCPILRGNHERYAAHFGTPKARPEWILEQFAPLQWAVDQLSTEELQGIEQLPLTLRFPETPGVFFVHASERDDHDSITAYTTEEELHEMFPAAQERTIIRAHNHYGQMRIWERGMIVTASSVGLPLEGHPTAQYLLLDQENDGWAIQHQSVAYDLEATLSRFQDTGYLASAGPMAHLFYREVLTGGHHIVPFLNLYSKWSQQEDISLSQAVDRFLSL
jgi:hypothetical protein